MDLQQEPEIRQLFRQLSPNSAILDGQTAAQVLQHSLLGVDLLERIWDMSDVDRDGGLTENEFVVAFHLCVCVLKRGLVLPSKLPLKLQQIFTRPNKFVKGDLVEHFRESDGVVRRCTVVGVHLDDLVNGVYYTLKLTSNGNELQSQESKLNYVGIWQKRQQVVVKEESDDDDEFGDFTQASGAVAIAAAPRNDFLDISFSGAPLPVATSTTTREDIFGDFTVSSPPQQKDVSFGDFTSFDFPPQQQPAQIGMFSPPQQQQHNDVSFGDFTSSHFPPPQQQQQPVQVGAFAPLKQQHNDLLLFGDFGPSPLQQQADAFGASSPPKQQDISFGDFSSFLPPVPPQTTAASPVRRFASAPVNESSNNNNNQFMLRRADSSGNQPATMSSFLSPIMPQPTSNTAPQTPAVVTTHFGQQAFDQDHQASFIASEASSSLNMQDAPSEEHPVVETDMVSNEFDSSMQFAPATTVYDRRNVVQDVVVVPVETMENEPMVVGSGEVNLFDFSEPTSITPANDLTKDMEEYIAGVAQTVEEDVTAPTTAEPAEEDIFDFSEPTVTRATKDKGEAVVSNAVEEKEPVPSVVTNMTEQEEEINFAGRDSDLFPITKATTDDKFGFVETNILQEEASSPIDFPEAIVSAVTDEKANDTAEPIASRTREGDEFGFPEVVEREEEVDSSPAGNVAEEEFGFPEVTVSAVVDDKENNTAEPVADRATEDNEFGFPEDNAVQEVDSSPATNVTEDEFGFPEVTVSAVVDDKENNTAEPVTTPPMAGDEFGFPSTAFAKSRDEEADTDAFPANKKTFEEDTLEFDFPEAEVAKSVEVDLSSTTNVMESDEFGFTEAVVQEKEETELSPATNVVEEAKVDSSLKEKVSVDPANDLEFDFPETIAAAAAEATKEDETVAVQSAAFEDPFDFFQVASSPMPTLSSNVPVVVEEETLQEESPNQINEFVENTSSSNNNNASSNSSFEVISPPAIDDDFDFFQTAAPTTQDNNDDDDFGDFQS